MWLGDVEVWLDEVDSYSVDGMCSVGMGKR